MVRFVSAAGGHRAPLSPIPNQVFGDYRHSHIAKSTGNTIHFCRTGSGRPRFRTQAWTLLDAVTDFTDISAIGKERWGRLRRRYRFDRDPWADASSGRHD